MDNQEPISLRQVARTWWPLALSWLLMALELPAVGAVIARLPDPEIHLAAYGGIVFPLAILIEAPIIMLLAASTALCKDWDSYRRVRSFMMVSGFLLTVVHVVVVFSPLYTWIARVLIGAPEEIIEPARQGLMVMPLWTWAIGYRRFQQGVLIRFGHSGAVGVGTILRLISSASLLALGGWMQLPGAMVGGGAVAVGVLVEAVYAGIRIQPVLAKQVRPAPVRETLPWRKFYAFYVPLALTPIITILAQPISSAAMSRMPEALPSLAAWPVLHGLAFVLRCLGMSYNEVVVALMDRPQSFRVLSRFTLLLAGASSAVLLVMAVTPLGTLWFGKVSSLPPDLVDLAQSGLWLSILLPAFTTFQSWYQGLLLHCRKTRFITESMVALLLALSSVFVLGIIIGKTTGLFIAAAAYLAGALANVSWLSWRSRSSAALLKNRDSEKREDPPDPDPETLHARI